MQKIQSWFLSAGLLACMSLLFPSSSQAQFPMEFSYWQVTHMDGKRIDKMLYLRSYGYDYSFLITVGNQPMTSAYFKFKEDSVRISYDFYWDDDSYRNLGYKGKTYHTSFAGNKWQLQGKEHTFTLRRLRYPYLYNPSKKDFRALSKHKLKTNYKSYTIGDTIIAKLGRAAGTVPSCDLKLMYWIQKKVNGHWEPYYSSSIDKGSCTDLFASLAPAKKQTYKVSVRYPRKKLTPEEQVLAQEMRDSIMSSRLAVSDDELLLNLMAGRLPEPIINEHGTYRLMVINTSYNGGFNWPWHRNRFIGDYRYLYSNRFKVK